jgi:hypothetical protein
MGWTFIESEKDLPPEGKWVLGRHSRGTWIDAEDQENVNCVIVKLRRGLTEVEADCRGVYTADDQAFNNLRPYGWHTFGPDHFFGQDIYAWHPIPETPVELRGTAPVPHNTNTLSAQRMIDGQA